MEKIAFVPRPGRCPHRAGADTIVTAADLHGSLNYIPHAHRFIAATDAPRAATRSWLFA